VTALEPLLLLHPTDNVAVARRALQAGETVTIAGKTLKIVDAIPANHKVALSDIPKTNVIRKFGQPIGTASADIGAGQWVHVQNVSSERDKAGYEFSTDIVQFPKPADDRTFMDSDARTVVLELAITLHSSAPLTVRPQHRDTSRRNLRNPISVDFLTLTA